MIGDMYATCIDEASIEKAGIKPISKYLKAIDKVKTAADLQREIAELHNFGFGVIFGFGAGPDLKASNNVIVNAVSYTHLDVYKRQTWNG